MTCPRCGLEITDADRHADGDQARKWWCPCGFTFWVPFCPLEAVPWMPEEYV